MIARTLLLATALFAASAATAIAQSRDAAIAQSRDAAVAAPALRASVTVSGDLVRIGDIIDNAGSAAQIAIYRAPDLGTTGALPVAQVLNTLRAHQVIGVDTRNLKEVSVTRLARTIEGKDIEQQVAHALERRNGLGDAANLSRNILGRCEISIRDDDTTWVVLRDSTTDGSTDSVRTAGHQHHTITEFHGENL